jgi:hypothetical protein
VSRTIETTVYTFDELSDSAKEKAREWYTSDIFTDSSAWGHVYDDAAQCAAIMGIEISTSPVRLMGGGTRETINIGFSGFWSQGDGANFEGSYAYKKGAAKAIRAYAPEDKELHRIADALQKMQARYFYKLVATMKHSGHYQHSGCMSVDVEHSDDSYRDIGDAEEDVRQLMRDFADWIYSQLEAEYDHQTDDDTVDENIRANEYEFTEDGGIA